MSDFKRPWKNIEALKDEKWELEKSLYGVVRLFKFYTVQIARIEANDDKDIIFILNNTNELTRYVELINRLKKDLEGVNEEIKEREDEEN